jgi:hypothetical protein
MDYEILRVIKAKHSKWNRIQCQHHVNKYIKLLTKNMPNGLPEGQYFVIPGYEDVPRFQPILVFNHESKEFELTSNTKFFKPIKITINAKNTEENRSTEGEEEFE